MVVHRNTNREIIIKTFKHFDKYLSLSDNKTKYLTLVIFHKETFFLFTVEN